MTLFDIALHGQQTEVNNYCVDNQWWAVHNGMSTGQM